MKIQLLLNYFCVTKNVMFISWKLFAFQDKNLQWITYACYYHPRNLSLGYIILYKLANLKNNILGYTYIKNRPSIIIYSKVQSFLSVFCLPRFIWSIDVAKIMRNSSIWSKNKSESFRADWIKIEPLAAIFFWKDGTLIFLLIL